MIDFLFEKVKKPFYLLLVGIIYLSWFLATFGIYNVNPKYLDTFSMFIQIFICAFLILRFHPFRNHELRDFDDKLIFGSGLILLTNLGVTSYLKSLINNKLIIF